MKAYLLRSMLIIFCISSGIGSAAQRPVIALLSEDTSAYQVPLQAYIDSLDRKVMVYNLKDDIKTAPAVMANIMQREPALIFALGAKAAYFAKAATRRHQDTAVLFAMVLNYQRYGLLQDQHNIAGIAADIAPGTQLFNMNLFLPNLKRIGVIYSAEFSAHTIKKAKTAADILGLELVAQPIKRAKEFKRAWLQIADKTDAFWVLNDPVLYNLQNIYWVKERCIKERQLCMGQSKNIARLGLLLSVNPDPASIGNQAASLSKDILEKNISPGGIGLRDPIGTRLTVNVTTTKKIGLSINSAAMARVNEVIEEK